MSPPVPLLRGSLALAYAGLLPVLTARFSARHRLTRAARSFFSLLRCSVDDLVGRTFAGAHGAFHKSVHLRRVFAAGPVNAACRFAQRVSIIREHAGSEVGDH